MTYEQAKSRNDKRGMGEAAKRQKRITTLALAAHIYGRRRAAYRKIKAVVR